MVASQQSLNISSYLIEKEAFPGASSSPLYRTRLFVADNGYAMRVYEDPDGSAYIMTTYIKRKNGTLSQKKNVLTCVQASQENEALRAALQELAALTPTPHARVPLAQDDVPPVYLRDLGIGEPVRPLMSVKGFGAASAVYMMNKPRP